MNLKVSNYCLLLLIFLIAFNASGQTNFPLQKQQPDQFISLNDGVPFDTALEILNQFSKRYEGKVIIDPKGRKDPIGVVIDNLYWKKAFEYIAKSHNLKYKIYDQYYELVDDPTKGAPITTDTREIKIQAVFFECAHKTLTELGIDWSTVKNGKIAVDQMAAKNMKDTAFRTAYQWTNGVWDVYALIDAFDGLEIGNVISKPQVKVMEGIEGEVQIGKNFYLTIRDYAGNTQFREYESGTILKVIPNVITIKDTTFIHLNLHVERSQVQEAATGILKDITESKTQVLLMDGERTVIGGLFSNETKDIRKGIPLLKDLPGWLLGLKYIFGYNSKAIEKKELIILIKAELIPQISKRKLDNDVQNTNFNVLRKRIKE